MKVVASEEFDEVVAGADEILSDRVGWVGGDRSVDRARCMLDGVLQSCVITELREEIASVGDDCGEDECVPRRRQHSIRREDEVVVARACFAQGGRCTVSHEHGHLRGEQVRACMKLEHEVARIDFSEHQRAGIR